MTKQQQNTENDSTECDDICHIIHVFPLSAIGYKSINRICQYRPPYSFRASAVHLEMKAVFPPITMPGLSPFSNKTSSCYIPIFLLKNLDFIIMFHRLFN